MGKLPGHLCGLRDESVIRVSSRVARVALAMAPFLIAACSAQVTNPGDGGVGPGPPAPEAPAALSLASANGQVLVDFAPQVEAESYRLYWSHSPGVTPATGTAEQVTAPPHVMSGFVGGGPLYAVVTSVDVHGTEGEPTGEIVVQVEPGGDEKYFPSWHDVEPMNVITLDYDSGLTPAGNGANLESMIATLLPGDRLEVSDGTWIVDSYFDVQLEGTAAAPIWVVAKDGAAPHISRSDANQNTINFGHGGDGVRYVCLRGFEISSGSIAVRIHDAENLWIDQCHVHDCADNAFAANSRDTAFLYFTRNEVHSTGQTGEGFYIGGNHGSPLTHDSVIALNHVHHTGGFQGDGIELKHGSWGNWIAENTVHDTNYPCILVGGTDGQPVNVVEKNVCWSSNTQVMQVQGEALVRNNVLINGSEAFYSSDHQGTTRDLVVVHNTMINTGHAVRLENWDAREGMVFSNNAVYSQGGHAMWFPNGSTDVEIHGNVVLGTVTGATAGFELGNGLTDFTDVTWDGSRRDVTPAPLGAMLAKAREEFAELEDVTGSMRLPPFDAGAADE